MPKINIEERFMIPTAGMKEYAPTLYTYPPEDCFRLTKFYEDCGHTFWPYDNHKVTSKLLFLQTGQGVFKLVHENDIEALYAVSDKNVTATCIRCNVPTGEIASLMEPNLGIANFIAARHPSHDRRVEMLCMLADIHSLSQNSAA